MNVSVKIQPLSIQQKCRKKLKKPYRIFSRLKLKLQDPKYRLSGEGDLESLRTLHLRLREERILDTARKIFLNGIKGDTTQIPVEQTGRLYW